MEVQNNLFRIVYRNVSRFIFNGLKTLRLCDHNSVLYALHTAFTTYELGDWTMHDLKCKCALKAVDVLCAVVASSIRGILFVFVCCYCCARLARPCSSVRWSSTCRMGWMASDGRAWREVSEPQAARALPRHAATARCRRTTSLRMLFRCGGLPHSDLTPCGDSWPYAYQRRTATVRARTLPGPSCSGSSRSEWCCPSP